jgi:hypothetical protein
MAGAKRPFWMHQLVEYVLGIVLLAQALQSETPALPAVAGGAIVLNAACTHGPLAAFRVVPRRVHRILDLVVVGLTVALAAQPWGEIESGARVVMLGLAAVLAFIWWQSDFSEKAKRPPVDAGGDRSTEIGRVAGRVVGGGVNTVKRWTKR